MTPNDKIPALFIDVDNCMVESLCPSSEEECERNEYLYGEYYTAGKFNMNGFWYNVFLRDNIRELLAFSRQLLGNDNVYILSTGVYDYVTWINHVLELGFDPNTNIFGRESIQGHFKYPKFECTHNVLIDNEDWWFHSQGNFNKVKFLNNLPIDNLITVPPFYVNNIDGMDKEYVEELKNEIIEKFFN